MPGQSEKIQLRDGRTLSFAAYGDAHGTPVFLFHGSPGSRFFRPPDETTVRLGVGLICTDRPGYGESTFQRGRRILDWPADILQLADSLGIDRFAVAGHSGGGPYALACAHALPDRVTAAATVSGAGPVEAPGATQGMTPLNRFAFKFGQYVPWPLGHLLTWWFSRERGADPAKAMDRDTGHRPPADDELSSLPAVREVCLQSELEAFRQGLRGFSWDVRLITRPWGFQLNEIKVPVYLWHGTADNLASMPMARYMAAQIPDCRATICEGEAHLLIFPYWEEILLQLH